MKRLSIVTMLVAVFFVGSVSLHADIYFNGQTSFIKASGGTFCSGNGVDFGNGAFIRTAQGSVVGGELTFEDGIFSEGRGQIDLYGTFDPASGLRLSGDGILSGIRGQILESIYISGTNNRIESVPILTENITLADSTAETTFAIESSINKNIVLNGGTIYLQDNLVFAENASLLGDGTIYVNGYRVNLSGEGTQGFIAGNTLNWINAADITLNGNFTYTGVSTFSGINKITGNGYIFDLSQGGEIIIDDDSTLVVSNVYVKGLGLDHGKITFSTDTSVLRITNSDFELYDNITTWSGAIYVEGPSTWVLKDNDWILDGSATLTVDGVTLWKDRAGAEAVGDITGSIGYINEGTIRATTDESSVLSVESDLDVLESRFDGFVSEVATETAAIYSHIDELNDDITDLDFSTDSRLDLVEQCCSDLRTSTGELQSQIDELGDDVSALDFSTDSRLDLLDDQVESLQTSTQELQSQIDELSDDIVVLALRIDDAEQCCSELRTSTGELQSQVDEIELEIADIDVATLVSRIDQLEDGYDQLDTSTQQLQSQVDELEADITSIDTEVVALESRLDSLDCCCTKEYCDDSKLKVNLNVVTSLHS